MYNQSDLVFHTALQPEFKLGHDGYPIIFASDLGALDAPAYIPTGATRALTIRATDGQTIPYPAYLQRQPFDL